MDGGRRRRITSAIDRAFVGRWQVPGWFVRSVVGFWCVCVCVGVCGVVCVVGGVWRLVGAWSGGMDGGRRRRITSAIDRAFVGRWKVPGWLVMSVVAWCGVCRRERRLVDLFV